jgi:hypothetical protein
MFAFFWAGVVAVVGLSVVFAVLIPLFVLILLFRVGLIFVKLAAAVVLLALFSVCLF